MTKNDLRSLYSVHNKENRGENYIFGGRLRIIPIIKYLKTLNLKDKRVLDLGCRDCALVDKYIQFIEKSNFYGIDVDSDSVDRARAKGYNVENDEINDFLQKTDMRFDLIIISEVLEHLPHPKETIRLMYKVLKPGGIVIFTVPNAWRLKNRIMFLTGRSFETDYTHLRWYNEAMLIEYFAEFGFKLIKIDYINSRFLWLSKKLFAHNILGLFGK